MVLSIMYARVNGKELPIGRVTTMLPYDLMRIHMRNKLYRKYPKLDFFTVRHFTMIDGNKTLIQA